MNKKVIAYLGGAIIIVMLVLVAVNVVAALPGSASINPVTRHYGGTQRVELPAGTKLVNATWDKDSSLWYVVRPMRADEEPEESTMKEDSTFGAMQGTVIFIESR